MMHHTYLCVHSVILHRLCNVSYEMQSLLADRISALIRAHNIARSLD